jgi:hypothetical protein
MCYMSFLLFVIEKGGEKTDDAFEAMRAHHVQELLFLDFSLSINLSWVALLSILVLAENSQQIDENVDNVIV